MPLIQVTAYSKPLSKADFAAISRQLATIFDTPYESVRWIWHRMESKNIYNWGELASSSNPSPFVEIVFRDRLSKAKIEIVYKLVSDYLAKKLSCHTGEIFIYCHRINAGDIFVLDRVWQGGTQFKQLSKKPARRKKARA